MTNYGSIALGGILTVTSLMAAFGIAAGINGLAWMWIAGFIAPALWLATDIVRVIGYDSAYTHTQGTVVIDA